MDGNRAPVGGGVLPVQTDEVIEIIQRHGGGGYPVNDYQKLFEHPQVMPLQLLKEVTLSSGEKVQVVRSPWRLTETPMRIESGPPGLGEHTESVLAALEEVISSLLSRSMSSSNWIEAVNPRTASHRRE